MIPAASTGRARRRRMVVTKMDHTNRGVWYWEIAGGFILMIVVIKLIEAKIEEIPAR